MVAVKRLLWPTTTSPVAGSDTEVGILATQIFTLTGSSAPALAVMVTVPEAPSACTSAPVWVGVTVATLVLLEVQVMGRSSTSSGPIFRPSVVFWLR